MTTVDRVGEMSIDTMTRNKRSLAVNLKDSRGRRIVTSLASKVNGVDLDFSLGRIELRYSSYHLLGVASFSLPPSSTKY